MRFDKVIKKLEAMADPVMAEYKYNRGCRAQICYGIKVSDLRKMAATIGKITHWLWNCLTPVFMRPANWQA